ncbi:Vps5-domain-containing protein [Dendrothele bispora CBS 962.96]|uniref:Vps5-domain-containing protein n=1 Tax=Dendrothele bispora (strain CBS 962.96) TaxID=1314807 RepID=A0A4S8LG68_DENBC|nr:Vps5-domain-containing protein [Dendrothele bispora CBS 962.96]
MDSFDDLLGQSRSVLEENPFSDPFSKRSASPDPWSTPFSQSDDLYTSPFATSTSNTDHDSASISESVSSPTVTEHAEATPEETDTTPSDPLDSAAANQEDDDDDEPLSKRRSLTASRSSGLRESVPGQPTFSEIATIRPDVSEERGSTPPPSLPSSSSTPPPIVTDEQKKPSSSWKEVEEGPTTPLASSSPSLPSLPPSQQEPPSTSVSLHDTDPFATQGPLNQSPINVVNRSFSSLPLSNGDTATDGWQAEHEPWSNDQPAVVSGQREQQPDDDSDDDKPIGQTVKRLSQSSTVSPNRNASTRTDLRPEFVITVDDPQKVGDPIRSFTMYTVHTRTTSPLYQKSAFSVLRRYSDFLWLYETLSMNNPGVVVPPVPEKNTFGRFDDHFVKQRRFALEKCIQKISNHPVLGKDADLKLFLESDTFSLDIKHRKAEIATERGGLMASIGQTIAGPRFYETDEWFDRQKAYLDSLESQLRGLVKAIDMVAKQRSELSVSTNEFAQALGDLATADVGKQLSQSLGGLAEVEKKAHDLQVTQSEQDMVTLMGTVDEYARLINSVRLAFSSRIRTYHIWKNAESEMIRIKQVHDKNRVQGRERMGHSLSQIAEAERRAADAKHEYEHCSKLVKTEVARFEQERIEDFKNSLHAFLEGMISRQKELINSWELYQQMLLKKGANASQSSLSS